MTVEYIGFDQKQAEKRKQLDKVEKIKEMRRIAFLEALNSENGQLVFHKIFEDLGFLRQLQSESELYLYNFSVTLFTYLKEVDEDRAFQMIRRSYER